MSCEVAILALDLTPKRVEFLRELINTLQLQTSLPVTVIGDEVLSELPSNYRQRDAQDILGFPIPWDLPTWYHEQLLALAFAATSKASFSLALPIGSFILRPLTEQTLLPRTLARTYWESVELHTDWWTTAADLTRRQRVSQWEGPSILPALLSRELATWTIEILGRENRQQPFSCLIEAAREGRHWSAMSLYATASGSRFSKFHHDPFDSEKYPLLTRTLIWNQALGERFGDDASDIGLMTYVQISQIENSDIILDRLYEKYLVHSST